MAVSPIANYQSELKELEKVENEVVAMVATIKQGSEQLQRWRDLMIVGTGHSFPGHVTQSNRSLNGNSWPSGSQIGELLAKWHSQKNKTLQAYQAIPDSERSVVKAPDQIHFP